MAYSRFALLLFLVPILSFAAPVVTFERQALQVSGVTSGGSVVCYAVIAQPQTFESRIVRHQQILPDSDNDGRVEIALASPIPAKSIWLIVDLTTLQYAVGSPPGFQPRQASFRDLPFTQSVDGLVTAISPEREFVDVVIVRAGVGAWQIAAGDGGISDSDRILNGRTTVLPSALQPIGSGPPPPIAASPGDFVAVIDIDRLQYFATYIAR